MWNKYNEVHHEDTQIRTKGYVDPDFVTNHKLTTTTRLEYYADITIPLKTNTLEKKVMFSFDMIKINIPILSNASLHGIFYVGKFYIFGYVLLLRSYFDQLFTEIPRVT